MTHIIITDADSRKAFDIYNIVRKHYPHIRAILTAEKDRYFQLPLIYGKKIHKLSSESPEIYNKGMDKIIEEYGRDFPVIYFPVSDKNIELFYQYISYKKNTLSPALKYLLPSEESYQITLYKNKFQEFCEMNSMPVPYRLSGADITGLVENFYPVVSKPFIGAGSVGLQFVNEPADIPKLDGIDLGSHIVQKKISNGKDIEGAFFLVAAGTVVSWYTHQRIRTFPESGGVTVYSKSTKNEALLQIAQPLLQKLNWSGLAMIEFMFDAQEGNYKIIELNPRTWGSFLLSEKSGLKFTGSYINLCSGKPAEEEHYREANIRWLIPFDLFLYLKGRFRIKGFWKFDKKNTAYINMTYGSVYSVFLFKLYFIFNGSSIKKFLKKIFGTGK